MMRENPSICVTVQVQTVATSWRAKITAPSIARALELAEAERSGRRVSVVFPVDPEEFFAGTAPETNVAALEPAIAA